MARFSNFIQAVDSHTAGEPTRIITGGLPHISGSTMLEKRSFLEANLDHVRSGLVLEPRGHDAIILAYITPPVSADSDFGVVFANDVGYLNMCGHGTIGLATVLVSTGMVEVQEPETRIVFDTPPGRVEAVVHIEEGRPVAVTIQNVPAFLHLRDQKIEVPGLGAFVLDVAYGGNWFGILSQEQVGIPVVMENLRELLSIADRVRDAIRDSGIEGFDPQNGAPEPIDHIEVYAPRSVDTGVGARTLTLCPGTAYDRSPCGTGTSAKLAVLHARGKLSVGEPFFNQSIVGTEFVGTVVDETEVGGRPAVVPQVRGSAYITGFQQFVFDPDDPLVHGFK